MSDDQGLTGGIDVFGKGLEVQQPELLQALETEPIVRHDRVVTLLRMADIVDVTHRPEVRSTPGGPDAFLGLLARTASFTIDPTVPPLRHHQSLMIRRLTSLPLVLEPQS